MRYCGYLIFAVCFSMLEGAAPAHALAAAALPPGVANSITVSNQSGAAIRNYPFQFGRPFLDGAIATAPQVLINGSAVATQADVKNRYPDGSVEYAVIATVIPSIPAGGPDPDLSKPGRPQQHPAEPGADAANAVHVRCSDDPDERGGRR